MTAQVRTLGVVLLAIALVAGTILSLIGRPGRDSIGRRDPSRGRDGRGPGMGRARRGQRFVLAGRRHRAVPDQRRGQRLAVPDPLMLSGISGTP
jgi:hypothetical protein